MAYSLIVGWTVVSLLTLTSLFLLAFIQTRRLTLEKDVIQICTYSMYGLKRQTLIIDSTSDIRLELFVNGDIDQVPDDDTPLGLIVFLLPFLYKKYSLWLYDKDNKTIMILRLTNEEYSLLKNLLPTAANRILPKSGLK